MIYKISKDNSFTKILGKDFVNTNRNKGFIIYNNKKISIREKIKNINYIKKEKNLKIKMALIQNISNINCIFENCEELLELKEYNIDKYDEEDNLIDDEEDINLYEYNTFLFEQIQSEESEKNDSSEAKS